MDNKKETKGKTTPKEGTGSKQAGITLKFNKDILTLVVLVVLVIVSGIQTVKLSQLKATGVSAAPAGSGGSSNLPSSLQNLPSQVGGC